MNTWTDSFQSAKSCNCDGCCMERAIRRIKRKLSPDEKQAFDELLNQHQMLLLINAEMGQQLFQHHIAKN